MQKINNIICKYNLLFISIVSSLWRDCNIVRPVLLYKPWKRKENSLVCKTFNGNELLFWYQTFNKKVIATQTWTLYKDFTISL